MTEINSFLFYIISLFSFVLLLLVIFVKKTISAIVSACGCFIGIGLLYFLLNAPFNAVAQIAIYATGVSLMLLFAVALINSKRETTKKNEFKWHYLVSYLGIALIFISAWLLLTDDFREFLFNKKYLGDVNITAIANTTETIGVNLLQKHILAFELFSIILLTALIGIAILLNKQERGNK